MDNRAIPESIKAKLPIEELVASYVPLKKMGRIYKGLCPFHNEKTPSFTVNPERGIYKCFGCGEGGDIFAFVMQMEGLTFPEAVRLLGERAGVAVPEWNKNDADEPKGPKKTRLFALNSYAAELWHKILVGHPKAEAAREYLKGRGLTDESIKNFQIGYAPLGNVNQTAFLKYGFTNEELRAAGEPSRFQDRITFPIADITGKVVGFTGRLLEHPDDTPGNASRGPKYWNSPETPLFVKSRILYALHLAKHAMQDANLAILAEGQMDVVMLHQYGYHQTVASSGTALTEDQLLLLRRFVPSIAFAYDGDKAGRDATKRGLEIALKVELVPYVIQIPNGKDPAECLQKDPELWKKAYEGRLFYMDWLLQQYLPDGAEQLSPEARRNAGRELVGWLHRMTDASEQAVWFAKVAAYLQTHEDNLRTLYARLFPNSQVAAPRTVAKTVTNPTTQNVSSIGETIAAIVMTFPEVAEALESQLEILSKLPQTGKLLPQFVQMLQTGDFIATRSQLDGAAETALNLVCEEILQPYTNLEVDAPWAASEVSLLLHRIREIRRESEKSRIAAAIQQAQTLNQPEKIRELFLELQNLA